MEKMEIEEAVKIGNNIRKALEQVQSANLLPAVFHENKPLFIDLSVNNKDVAGIDMTTPEKLREYVLQAIKNAGTTWAVGGYGEQRTFYGASSGFIETEGARNIHLGLDVWVPAGTEIFAPLAGTVHSFQDNNKFLDYGPAIILEHKIAEVTFYTLYGHLSRESLPPLHKGMEIYVGQKIANIGKETENGSWPPHLHFQIIGDMLGLEGDFIGVASKKESDFYLNLCPDPNLILKIAE